MKNGLKFDGEKIDLSLMPPEWIYAFSELFAAGMTFQSTPPRGGRRLIPQDIIEEAIVSIHAPARGATIVDAPVAIYP